MSFFLTSRRTFDSICFVTRCRFFLFVFVGNCLQQALRKIGKENIVHNCVFNIEWVTDAAEKELARSRLTNQNLQADGNPISGRRVRVDSQLRFFSLNVLFSSTVGRRFRK